MDDPRVRKTRRNLRAAFMRLVMEKGYDAISIQDITKKAETARITFYRHYHDKEDLLTDCLNTLYEDFVEKIEREISPEISHISVPIRVFYEHLEAEELLYQVLFSSLGTQTVVKRLTHYMSDRLITQLEVLPIVVNKDIPLDIVANHLASAQIGLGIWWLEQNKPYPIEDMTAMSISLSLDGILKVLGVSG
jgi:AcrR family transcriptional regulator